MRTTEEFKEAILGTFEKMRWGAPTIYEDYCRNHMSREGARVYGLEHCVFAANFPRWIANVTGNTPHLDVRKYLIEVQYVEEVRDPTITTGHYESLVDFVVALGADREFVLDYTGAPITRMRIAYCDWASRTRPWLEAFAVIAGNEVARGPEMIKRVGGRARSSRHQWASLGLDDKALAHWDAADEADSSEGGHGAEPLDIMLKYADTQEKQDAVLAAIAERQEINRIWFDQIGIWQYEASGLEPPLPSRQPMPAIKLAA